MELIKGKWYKVANHNLYFKYYETTKQGEIYYLESIIDSNYIERKDWLSISNTITEVKLSEISQWLPENHPDKQLKPEDFIGKWVTCKTWKKENSYAFVKSIREVDNFYFIDFIYQAFNKNKIDDTYWVVYNLSDLQIVNEAEVAKKAIEYGHDLKKLGLHQFISVRTIKKEDLYNTKIWIGDDEELSKKVQERLFELGFKWNSGCSKFTPNCAAIFIKDKNNFTKTSSLDKEYFYDEIETEITLSDLGLNNEVLIQKGLEIHNQIEQSLNSITIIPVIQETTNINIPEIKLNNLKLTI